MWLFKKKPLEPDEPLRNYPVPAEHVEEFCVLYDALSKSLSKADKYKFWKFCNVNVPGYDAAVGRFQAVFDDILHVSLQEVTGPDD